MSDVKLAGGCICGAVRYECRVEPLFTAHCHCRDCQRASGAPMSTVFAAPRAGFEKTGETATYAVTGDSGNPVIRHFCPKCGAPLFTDARVMPDVWFVRAASLDDPTQVTPSMHVYCDSALPWDPAAHDTLPRFGKLPG